MKNAILILSLAICTANVFAQSADEKEILTIINKQAADWSRGNIDDFMSGYWHNDSVMYVGHSGITYGYNNILTNYKKSFPDTAAMGTLSFDILHKKQLSPEYFLLIGRYNVVRTKGNASGHFTLLFQKIGGKWWIISDHSS